MFYLIFPRFGVVVVWPVSSTHERRVTTRSCPSSAASSSRSSTTPGNGGRPETLEVTWATCLTPSSRPLKKVKRLLPDLHMVDLHDTLNNRAHYHSNIIQSGCNVTSEAIEEANTDTFKHWNLRLRVNFTKILQAAFALISFCQRIINPNFKHRKAAQNTFVRKSFL